MCLCEKDRERVERQLLTRQEPSSCLSRERKYLQLFLKKNSRPWAEWLDEAPSSDRRQFEYQARFQAFLFIAGRINYRLVT